MLGDSYGLLGELLDVLGDAEEPRRPKFLNLVGHDRGGQVQPGWCVQFWEPFIDDA